MVKPIPEGYQSITPSLTFKDTQKALDFYKKAFGATAIDLFPNPNGKGLMHATIRIGNSILMMGDEMPGQNCSPETVGGSPISLFLYVPNVDTVFQQAVAAGCKPTMPVTEMFWGDRAGNLQDPFGYAWMIATHVRDMTQDQIRKEGEAFFASFTKKK